MKATRHLKIEPEREEDGRWLAELPDMPGAMAYDDTRENAIANVQALALRIAADKIEAHDRAPEIAPLTAVFAFHDSVELGPAMLARIARHTGLHPQAL